MREAHLDALWERHRQRRRGGLIRWLLQRACVFELLWVRRVQEGQVQLAGLQHSHSPLFTGLVTRLGQDSYGGLRLSERPVEVESGTEEPSG